MRFRRRLSPDSRADLIPLIDVVFQLVVFFMVSTTFRMAPGIALQLPTAVSAEPVEVTEIVVTITSDNNLYLGEDPVSLDDLGSKLKDLQPEEPTAVVIEGNAAVSYDTMIRVLDAVRLAGFPSANLRTLEQ